MRTGTRAALALAAGLVLALLLAVPRAEAHRAEAHVFLNRAITAYEDGRYEEALGELAEARALDPEHVEVYFYTGLANAALGRLEEARAAFEQARARSPDDEGIRFQLGVVLFHLERNDEAAAYLEELFRARPSREALGYYVGVLRHRRGDDPGALEALRAGVSKDPDIQQLTRFYMGIVLVKLGLPESAEAEIEEALRLQPGSPLTGSAERLRAAAASARERSRRFRAQVRVGAYYDDNVPVKPELTDDPIVQSLRGQEKESPGVLTALRADYAFLRRGAFEASTYYSFYSTTNTDLPEFDILDHVLGVGGLWNGTLFSLPAQAAVDYNYEYVLLALEEFLGRHSVSPYVTLVANDWNSTSLQARFQSKDFDGDGLFADDDRRNGENWLVGFLHVLRFGGDTFFAKAGYQYDMDDTDGRNFEYDGHRLIAGFQAALPYREIRLSYDFDVHFRDYRHANTSIPLEAPGTRERSDDEMNHTLWLTVPLPRSFTLAVVGQHTDASSNLDPFEYERNVATLQLIWSY